MSPDERLQAICDLAAARLENVYAVNGRVQVSQIETDLSAIVSLTGKTWRKSGCGRPGCSQCDLTEHT